MPVRIPPLSRAFFERLPNLSLQQIAVEVVQHLLPDTLQEEDWKKIADEALTFDAPLVCLDDSLYVLELFHGPTLSFKDFGACFMARLMRHFTHDHDQELHILVATSGDTGSAVGHGFLNIPGIKVWILYPKGKVSEIQEKQLTTIGGNVTAIELNGTFDDCQALVKRAFSDQELRRKVRLTSANSINITRLIPQIFYYIYAYAQLSKAHENVLISVPSGNFGNLTAGLFAKKMGLPVTRFIGATNINDSIPKYLRTNQFKPRPSRQTISNAMDVGNPSNFARMLALYSNDISALRKDLWAASFTDSETKRAIQELKTRYNYLIDPHGAVAYLGVEAYRKLYKQEGPCIFLETAHPAKFLDVVQPLTGELAMPEGLKEAFSKPKQALLLPNDYEVLKSHLEGNRVSNHVNDGSHTAC